MPGRSSSARARGGTLKGAKAKIARPKVYYVLSSEQFAISDLVEYGVAAEKAGFDGVWTSDHFQPWQPNEEHSAFAWVTLAALSQRTSQVKFGTGVTCPSFRYLPAIVAQAWASLSLLAPGRPFLGVGAGENLNEGAAGGGWSQYPGRASRLIEAIKIIRALWSGNHVKIRGQFWNVNGKLYDFPSSMIPLYVAAGGLNSANIAGRYGDGLITGAGDLKKGSGLLKAWSAGVREKGKDPRSQVVMVEHWAIVGREREAREAARKWRFVPKAWEPGFFDNMSPEKIQERAEKEIPIQKVYQDWPVSTDPEVHVKAILELAELGATHVVVHVPTPNQRKVIDFFGRRVLPAIR